MKKLDRFLLFFVGLGVWALVMTSIFEPKQLVAHDEGMQKTVLGMDPFQFTQWYMKMHHGLVEIDEQWYSHKAEDIVGLKKYVSDFVEERCTILKEDIHSLNKTTNKLTVLRLAGEIQCNPYF